MDVKILLNDTKIVVIGSIIAICVYYFTNNITTSGYVIGATLIGIGAYHISILVKFMNDYEKTIVEEENEDN